MRGELHQEPQQQEYRKCDDQKADYHIEEQAEINADCAGILREALRLYPPLPTIARMATREVVVEGHAVPAGTRLIVAPLFV